MAGIVSGTATVIATFLIGKTIDKMVGKGQVDFQSIFHLLLILGIAYVLTIICQWLVTYYSNQVSFNGIKDLRVATFEKINQLPLSFFDTNSHGNLISRFTNDLDSLSDAVSLALNNLFSGGVVIIVCLIFMLYLSPLLTLVILLTTPLVFIVAWVVAKVSQKNFNKQQRIVGEMSGFVSEMVGNQKIIKAFRHEEEALTDFSKINQNLYTWGQKAQFTSSLTNPSARFTDHLCYLLVGVVGGVMVVNGSGNITVGIVSSFIIYSAQFSKPFIELSGITTQIQTAMSGLKRIVEIFETENQVPESEQAITLKNVRGEVDLEAVQFAYQPERPLIKNLNLEVKSGSKIAVVGKTGAGKSTLINLLMRFYELNGGDILIDGTSIKEITRDSLRLSFGMVLQETWLFGGTIKENIAYGNPEATDQEIEEAAHASFASSFIEKLPKKYETYIGTGGVSLSEGEQQLLTIARAMLANPAMLILDEATSSVDTLTELKIQEGFLKMMEGRTSFVIAHRLSTIREADTILVMDQGDIVEQGNHHELLAKQGAYYELYMSQFA